MSRERPIGHMRLDAFLARAGLGTRSEVRRFVRQGRVTIDAVRCRRAGEPVAGRVVAFDGSIVAAPRHEVHLVLNKPVGFACSHDPRESPIIGELIPPKLAHLTFRAAGRLDRETSGLLVLSTDGAVVHDLTHPSRKVWKRYRVRFEGRLPVDAAARCEGGLVIAGSERPLNSAHLEVDAEDRATISIREGRFHQVRRMFGRLGVRVVELHRDRIGGYDLPDDLDPGALRLLAAADLDSLRSDSSL